MLQKSRSRKIWQFKYLVLVPLVLSMLMYSSCENDEAVVPEQNSSISEQVEQLKATIAEKENLTEQEKQEVMMLSEIVVVGYEVESAKPEGDYPKLDHSESGVGVPFAVVDQTPVFPGCENAADPRSCFREKIQKHIRKHFRYPEEAQQQGIQGRVAIMFTIDKQGNIVDIRKRGPSPILEKEAVRIIERLPKMTPGEQKGQPVNVPFSIPITFRLSSASNEQQHSGIREDAQDRKVVAFNDISKSNEYVYGSVSNYSKGLPGANVMVKGTDRGTITDFDGNFKIRASKGEVLTVNYIGLSDMEFTVNDENRYKVAM